ncbi:MAG: hypothetical protein CMD36_01315 [Flavobacteriales bacterium]|nr:hypothetical protein [Flavobacteriales bacterium]|tara:strand:- start:2274 stop:2888 length:615 start_codon:yes stop_codon:yes gene_type:complete
MKLFFCFLILISSISNFSDEKIKGEIIDDIVTKISGYKNISIDFDLLYENISLDIKTNKKGKLILENDKFSIDLDEQMIINNGDIQWTYLKDINEVQISNNEITTGVSKLSDLFKISKNDYKILFLKDEINFYLIELIPKTIKSFIKIQIKFQKQNKEISEIKVFDKEGGKFTYSINRLKYDLEINSFYFDTSKFPGIEIIDLR